jgi:hypothetical protein
MTVKRQNINLGEETNNILETCYRGSKSSTIRRAVGIYYKLGKILVVTVTSRITGRVFVTCTDADWFDRADLLAIVSGGYEELVRDVRIYGTGEFDLKPVALFATRTDALNYVDILTTQLLDEGKVVYNSEAYIDRKTVLKIDSIRWDKFVKVCNEKGISRHSAVMNLIKKALRSIKKQ